MKNIQERINKMLNYGAHEHLGIRMNQFNPASDIQVAGLGLRGAIQGLRKAFFSENWTRPPPTPNTNNVGGPYTFVTLICADLFTHCLPMLPWRYVALERHIGESETGGFVLVVAVVNACKLRRHTTRWNQCLF